MSLDASMAGRKLLNRLFHFSSSFRAASLWGYPN